MSCEDFEAAVPPPSDDSVSAHLRAGCDEGLTKLQLYYKGAELYARYKAGHSVAHVTSAITVLEEKRGALEARKSSFQKSFLKAGLGKGGSFAVENSLVLGATVAGAMVGGAYGGVTASAAATYPQVFGYAFLEDIRAKGHDLNSQEQIYMALEDDALMKDAEKRAHIYAGKMSGGVLLAGAVAGYAYRLVAQPAVHVARSLASSFTGAVKAEVLGEVLAEGFKSATNSVSKRIVEAIPARSLLVAGAARKSFADPMEERHDMACAPVMHEDYGSADYDGGLGDKGLVHAGIYQNFEPYQRAALYL